MARTICGRSTPDTATQATALDAQHRAVFTAPFSFSHAVTMSSKKTKDLATDWNSLSSSTTNQSTFDSQNDNTQPGEYKEDGWSGTKVYSTPFTDWDMNTETKLSHEVLAELVSGSSLGTPASTDADGNLTYQNAATANMYYTSHWDQFACGAMKAVALRRMWRNADSADPCRHSASR